MLMFIFIDKSFEAIIVALMSIVHIKLIIMEI